MQHLLDEEEAKLSGWQGRLQKQQRAWLENVQKEAASAPRLAPDNHASDSISGRALVAAPLKAASATAAIATRSNE